MNQARFYCSPHPAVFLVYEDFYIRSARASLLTCSTVSSGYHHLRKQIRIVHRFFGDIVDYRKEISIVMNDIVPFVIQGKEKEIMGVLYNFVVQTYKIMLLTLGKQVGQKFRILKGIYHPG